MLQITLLGGFSVRSNGRDIPPTEWKRRKAAAIVADSGGPALTLEQASGDQHVGLLDTFFLHVGATLR